jgi:hypothetical protein
MLIPRSSCQLSRINLFVITKTQPLWRLLELIENYLSYYTIVRPQVVAQWLNSPLCRVGLRFESQLCFFLPATRHQEILGVGYAHHTCGRRPWVWTLLSFLVCLCLSDCDSIHDLLGLSPLLPNQGARARYLELT